MKADTARSVMQKRFLAAAAALSLGSNSAAAAQAMPGPPAGKVAQGVWDLTWQTRRGPEANGFLVLTENGTQLSAKIHGRGAVSARGLLSGTRFHLTGKRMLTPYRIDGEINGNTLRGSIRVLSVQRHFTGVRRPSPVRG
jgi:hypothetical protein